MPEPFDLVDLDQVRQFLQKPDGDLGQNEEIESEISDASEAIIDHCAREFAPQSGAGVARKFLYRGGGVLDLAPYDLQAATLVRIDTDGSSPRTLTAGTGYKLRPVQPKYGVYDRIQLPTEDASGEREVTITGTWGFPSVPRAVQRACIITVGTWLRRDVAAFERTFLIDENRLERPKVLPDVAMSLLAPFRRHMVR